MYSVILLLFAQSCFGACAITWTNGYGKCVEITLDHTKIPNTNQTDFTNLICFNGAGSTNCDASLGTLTLAALKVTGSGGSATSSSCYDCIFTSDNAGTTLLNWETEIYTGASGFSVFWVKLTRSHTTDDKVYLFIGNSSTTTFQGGSLGSAWSAASTGIFHVSDGITLSVTNSVVNSAVPTSTAVTAAAGEIDGGSSYAGAGKLIIGSAELYFTTAASFSGWVNGSAFANAYNTVMAMDENAGNVFGLLVKSNGKLACGAAGVSGTAAYDGTGSHTLSTSTWYHVVLTYSSATGLIAYVNGAVDATVGGQGNLKTVTPVRQIWFGQHPSIGTRLWNGLIDEGRLYNVAITADWVNSMYNNESSPSTFYSAAAAIDPILGISRHKSYVF